MRVFKYRGGLTDTLRRDLRSLANNQIYSAPIETLNDPFEAQVEVRGETFRLGRLLSLFPGVRYSEAAHTAEDRFITEITSFVEKTKTFGIYSLSKSSTNELLWAYYANAHNGFCIEYDLDELLRYKLGGEGVIHVQYEPKIPVISIADLLRLQSDNTKLMTKLLGTKSKKWKHEQEVRIVTGRTGHVEYDYRAVKGVYFGHRCSPQFHRLVMRVLAGRGMTYYQIVPVDGSYKLQAKPIADLYSRSHSYRKRIAPVEEGAPYFDATLEPYRSLVLKAVEIVRREPYCERVTDAYLSRSKGTPDNPLFYVTYMRSDGIAQNYFISKAELQANGYV